MRILLFIGIALTLYSCQGDVKTDNAPREVTVNDSKAPVSTKVVSTKSSMSQAAFDSLHLWELGRQLMVPYYEQLQAYQFQDSLLYAKLNEDQRQFYYFWQMDNTISENGFLSIFPLRNTTHIDAVLNGLKAWGADETHDLIAAVIEDFKKNEKDFIQKAIEGELQTFAKNHDWYNRFTKPYLDQHEKVMEKAESYIRENPDSFIMLK